MTLSSSGYGFCMKTHLDKIDKSVAYLKFTKNYRGENVLDRVEIFPNTLFTVEDFREYTKTLEEVKTFIENS